MSQYLKIALFIFNIVPFMPTYSALEVIKEGCKTIGNEIGAQIITSTAWTGLYGSSAIIKGKSFHIEAKNFEGILRKEDGSPKTLYKIGRTVFNLGDWILNPQLPFYVAKKLSDAIITDGIGNVAYYVTNYFTQPSYYTFKPKSSDQVGLAQMPFRDMDEIKEWETKGKKIEYSTRDLTDHYLNRFKEVDNLSIPAFFTLLRCLVKGTLGQLITRQIYKKLFPYVGAKLAPQGRMMHVIRTLDAAFNYTHPINLLKKLRKQTNLIPVRKTI